MALKKTISKAEFDALPSDFQKEYKASGENFVLDLEGDDGIDWKRKRDIEAEHRKTAEDKAKKAQEELDDIRRGNIPKADVDALETSWKTKITEEQTKASAREAELQAIINNVTVDNVATSISQIFLAPAAMLPMVRTRLKSEIVNGVAVTRVLDKNGQPTALTVDDLQNEFKADATLAPVIVASKASGTGAGGQGGGGGAPKKLKDMGDKERLELMKTNRPEFDRLVREQNSTK